MAGAVWRVENLVVEDRKVESETEADRVSGSELGLGNIGCALPESQYDDMWSKSSRQ